MLADSAKSTAIRFVVFMGIVSLFADVTYEGARSITGPYLGELGASAAIVGFVAGFGEFLGYALRLVSGYIADRTSKYWMLATVGYTVNLLAIPLLAFANQWWIAGFLIIAERAGKGIRNPARDAMISHAAQRMGLGWGFGLHEALDKAGAMMGPLLVAFVLYIKYPYQSCFMILAVPALAALCMLVAAQKQFPNPQDLEESETSLERVSLKTNKSFWIYLLGSSFVALGYADFALMAFHFEKIQLLTPVWIPISYSLALGTNILVAPLLGYLYDRHGFMVLIAVTLLASCFAPMVFYGDANVAVFGIVLWAIGMGAQGSLMRAIVASLVPKTKRGAAYGIFYAVFGLFWFVGSAVMGILYDISISSLVCFSVISQLLSLPILMIAMREIKSKQL